MGQFVDVSMADCLLSLIFDEPLDCYRDLNLDFQQGNRIMRFSPFNAYKTEDGWITIGAATNDDWRSLLEVMNRSDLFGDENMMSVSSIPSAPSAPAIRAAQGRPQEEAFKRIASDISSSAV